MYYGFLVFPFMFHGGFYSAVLLRLFGDCVSCMVLLLPVIPAMHLRALFQSGTVCGVSGNGVAALPAFVLMHL